MPIPRPGANTVARLIYDLIEEPRTFAKNFHNKPFDVMNHADYSLDHYQQAVVLTSDRAFVASHIKKVEGIDMFEMIELFSFEDDWPTAGPDLPWPYGARVATPSFSPFAKSGWTDPEPSSRGVKPPEFKRGDTNEPFWLVGQGFHPKAKVTLISKKDRSKKIEATMIENEAKPINFRRIYLKGTVTVPNDYPTGEYEIRVRNHPDIYHSLKGVTVDVKS